MTKALIRYQHFLRYNYWIQFIGSNCWIQLSAWYTRYNSLNQYSKCESSKFTELDENCIWNWWVIEHVLLSWSIVMKLDGEREKRQLSLSFFQRLQFFSKDADTFARLYSMCVLMRYLAGKLANHVTCWWNILINKYPRNIQEVYWYVFIICVYMEIFYSLEKMAEYNENNNRISIRSPYPS